LAVALGGCRLAAPTAPLPADWAVLVAPIPSYKALYRLSCCGRRDLVAALRGSTGVVHLSVAAPPAGSLLEVWVDGAEVEIFDGERRCRSVVTAGVLPLTPELTLPLAPATLAALVSGRLVAAAGPIEERPGWVEAAVEGVRVRERITGQPPRATALELVTADGVGPGLTAVMTAHRGLVPGVLEVKVGERSLRLELQVWEQGVEPAPPVWLSLPTCGGGG